MLAKNKLNIHFSIEKGYGETRTGFDKNFIIWKLLVTATPLRGASPHPNGQRTKQPASWPLAF
jgi:hypothetical protein